MLINVQFKATSTCDHIVGKLCQWAVLNNVLVSSKGSPSSFPILIFAYISVWPRATYCGLFPVMWNFTGVLTLTYE